MIAPMIDVLINLPLAINRGDIAHYVNVLFTVYFILIVGRILIGWVVTLRGSIPYYAPLQAVVGFIEETVDPYLNIFRGFLPPIGGRGMALDLSPILGIIVLLIAQGIVVGLIDG